MKLAYIGYDKTLLKAHAVLEQQFSMIDSYFVNAELESGNLNFFNLPIVADNVCIPPDEANHTFKHKSILYELKDEYAFLKKNLFSDYKLTDDEVGGIQKSSKKNFSFDDVVSIYFDKKKKKHMIQNKDNSFIEYDYLIVQGHQLVSERLLQIKQNVMKNTQKQSFLFLNIEFYLKYKLDHQHLRHELIYINNTKLKSVFDNWYICSFSQNRLLASLLIPYSKYSSTEFLDFVTNRTLEVLTGTFDSFIIENLKDRWISASDGFVESSLKLNFSKQSSVFPSFDYWTQNKINNYVKNLFILKNFKNLNHTSVKDHT